MNEPGFPPPDKKKKNGHDSLGAEDIAIPASKKPESKHQRTPENPEKYARSAGSAYLELGNKVREMGIDPEDLPPEAWASANAALDKLAELSGAFKKERDFNNKKRIIERMKLLRSKMSGTLSREIEKAAQKAKLSKFSPEEMRSIVSETLDYIDKAAKTPEEAKTPEAVPVPETLQDVDLSGTLVPHYIRSEKHRARGQREMNALKGNAERAADSIARSGLDLDLSESGAAAGLDLDLSEPQAETAPLDLDLSESAAEQSELPPAVFRSNRRPSDQAAEALAGRTAETVPEQEIPQDIASGDYTPKELHEMLQGLIGKAKGKFEWWKSSEENLIRRSQELDAEAEKIGGIEGKFRLWGERYNKLGWKSKLLIGASLGIGMGASASFAFAPALMACGAGIVAQRALALSTMYLKFEKESPHTEKREGSFWQWGSKEKAMAKAILYTAGMTAGTLLIAREAKEVFDSPIVRQWLEQHYPFSHTGAAPTHVSATHEAASHIGTPHIQEMPVVAASHGHGYEYMMKRLWEDLHAKGVALPANADPHSDLARLIAAKPDEIDKIVHQIAADPKHAFFHTGGASVRIDPSAHMTIGTDGQIHLSVGSESIVHAPVSAPVTPSLHAEAPAAPLSGEMPSGAPEGAQIPVLYPETYVPNVEHGPAETAIPSEHPYLADSQHPAPIIEHSFLSNTFGLSIPVAEPHIYADAGGRNLFVYGGSLSEQADKILAYLSKHPDGIVYGTDDAGAHRIPWRLVGGEAIPGVPARTNGIFGFFSSWMKAPNPSEFAKVVS